MQCSVAEYFDKTKNVSLFRHPKGAAMSHRKAILMHANAIRCIHNKSEQAIH